MAVDGLVGVENLAAVDAHAAHVHRHHVEAGDEIDSRYGSQHRLGLSATTLGMPLLDPN